MNIRQKGQTGEREVALLLNGLIMRAMRELGFPEEKIRQAATTVQRNQNQSAVGGNDLTNTLGLSIEVKRQEQLSVNTWWKQCLAAAERNNEIPVLIYRQNKQAWRVVMPGKIELAGATGFYSCRVEITYEDFQEFWIRWVKLKLMQGELVRI